jgi:hypothetical protein
VVKELYINDSFIELSDLSRIGVTFQANTLSNLETRQGTFSNEFVVPRTQANVIALENSNNINSDTVLPYRKNGVKYLEDGIEIVVDGFAIIQSFQMTFTISIYSGNVDPFDLMGDDMLNDLDFSAYDHLYTAANVIASYPNTEGYIYPSVDLRKYTSSLSPSVMGRSLFMFIRTLMEKIFAEIGYTLQGDLLEDIYYVNMILSTSFKRDEAWQDLNNSRTTLVSAVANTTIISAPPITTVYNIGFPTSGFITGGIYNVPEPMSASFSAVIPVQFGLTGSGSQFAISASMQIVNVTTATILDSDTINPNTDIGGGAERFYTFQVNTGNQSLNTADQIQIRFEVMYSATGIYKWTYLTGGYFGATVVNAFIPYNSAQVYVSKIQHELKQKEFVKGILNLFNAVPQSNLSTKVITINKLNDIQKNIAIANNWSKKIDVKKGFSISYRDNSFAQKNLLKYSNDQDVLDAIDEWYTYATDGEILVDDENLTDEQTIITLPFSGTKDNRIPYKNDDYSIDEFTPRVLFMGRFFRNPYTGIVAYYPTQDQAGFSNSAIYESLSFYDNGATHHSFSENYSTMEAILNRYKKITAYFNLNSVDIAELDFLIPIYLDVHTAEIQVNGYFYLNKVENYKGGELTKCELIRL